MKLIHGHPNLRKGTNGVILNVSTTERDQYRAAKQMALKQRESQSEIQDLKSELKEVKDLLHQLIKSNGAELST